MSAALSSTLPAPTNRPSTTIGQGFDPPRTPRASHSFKDRRVAVKPTGPSRLVRARTPRASSTGRPSTPLEMDLSVPGPSTSTLPLSARRPPSTPQTPRTPRTARPPTATTTPRQGSGLKSRVAMGAGRTLWTKKSGAPTTPRQRGGGVGGSAVAGGTCPLGFTIQSLTQVTSPPADRLGLSFLDYSNDLDTHEALFSSQHIHQSLLVARRERKPRVYIQYCAHCRDHAPHLERAWEVLSSVIQACPNLDYAQALPPHLPTLSAAPVPVSGGREVDHFLRPEAHKYRPVQDCSEIYLVCQPWGGLMKTLKVTDPTTAISALRDTLPGLQEANLSVHDLKVTGLPKRLLRSAPSPYLKVRVGEGEQSTQPQPATHNPEYTGTSLAFRVDQPRRQTLEVEVWNDKGGKGKANGFMGRAVLDLSSLQCGQGVEREVPLRDNGLGGSKGMGTVHRLGVLTCSVTALGDPFDGADSLSAQSPSPSTQGTTPPLQAAGGDGTPGSMGMSRWGESVSSLPELELEVDVLDSTIPYCLPDFSATIG